MKNRWLITMIMPASRSSMSPIAMWLSARKDGSGHPHIICPMEKYMRINRKIREAIKRFLRAGVSVSFNSSASSETEAFFLSKEALYPAAFTAAMISLGEAVPSTPMELVSRLTAQVVTPGTLETAFSTRALQAAQCMPLT